MTDRSDAAVSQVIDFVVALGIFLLVIGVFLTFGPDLSTSAPGQNRDALARNLADALVSRTGLGNATGVDWQDDPDDVALLGFKQVDDRRLSYAKIAAVARGETTEMDNEAVDYPAARWALGLAELSPRFDVELRMRPRPQANASGWDTDVLQGSRVAYVGTNASERGLLADLSVEFDNATGGDGEVYGTSPDEVNRLLLDLQQTPVIVVGSDVDHAPLDTADVGQQLDAWLRAGGGLVVLGSDQVRTTWLAEIVPSLSYTSSGGAIEVQDPDHPARRLPHEVEIDRYTGAETSGGEKRYWSATETFHVAARDAGSADRFALAHRFVGDGVIVLTTYRPREVARDVNMDEAHRLQANLVHLAGTGAVNLDYGLEAPQEARTGTTVRNAVVAHGRVGDVRGELQVTVWG